ncbi:hypothetical protein HOB10_03815 [Candidatus Parcubacteria bacterium]|jgi:hypothetical protein|nr:hypothetical protein [Candidatus Parcubacteria bacterium]
MKTSYSIAFFIVLLIVVSGLVVFYEKEDEGKSKVLLQTLECHSDKIDSSVSDLDSDTSLIGAMISFKAVPIDEDTKNKLTELQIVLDEHSWIFDYVVAKIPTDSLCELTSQEQVTRVFIPEL